ncbi:GNAT family N-acetyltransferase [Enterococcus gallinarum]|uniref:GNAT family N-acetyltransferase n=1 Tax=Enterococcus gallinarum TaxID=1353 RepID=UPI0036F2244A
MHKNESGEIVSAGTLSPEFLAHEESHGYNEHTKCIQRLVTKASEMGNGLGSAWVKTCLRDFCKAGDAIYSLTNHTNKPMQHLFEKTGFSLIETTSVTGREAFGPFYIYKRNR